MKKRPLWLLTFGICFVFLFMSANTKAATPVQKWGQLKVSGTNIVNKDGKKVQLKGVSTHGIAWFPQYVNKSCFQSFKKMGVNTIRLALYSDKGAGYSKSLYQKVDEGIRYATELGMYVVLDWHILSDGNPKTSQKQGLSVFYPVCKKVWETK